VRATDKAMHSRLAIALADMRRLRPNSWDRTVFFRISAAFLAVGPLEVGKVCDRVVGQRLLRSNAPRCYVISMMNPVLIMYLKMLPSKLLE
jgi:hypothetical protein